jgi:predicted ATPase
MLNQSRIELRTIEFGSPAFRKLGNMRIEFGERFTVIAGHNGIGKSTILALIANASGLSSSKEFKSYFNENAFQANLNEIIHLDSIQDYDDYNGSEPDTSITYEIAKTNLVKRCDLVKRETGQIRVVPRNSPTRDFVANDLTIKGSSKVPLPTLYLGMTRALPVGESEDVVSSAKTLVAEDDAAYIEDVIQRVIPFNARQDTPNGITSQSIKRTKKFSLHPDYAYNTRCVSLGQDNVSSIATALASFRKLKREMPTYPGGLLLIDEVDAGLHPRAQEKLFAALTMEARALDLQIIVTTHSLNLIRLVHPDFQSKHRRVFPDRVVYLTDTGAPRAANYTYEQISNDMQVTLGAPKVRSSVKKLKVYLEDLEAEIFFNALLTPALKSRVRKEAGVTLNVVGLGAGSENFKGYVRKDPYFKSVLIVLDGDAALTAEPNFVALPGGTAIQRSLSPERTLIQFLRSIVEHPDQHGNTLQKVTTDFIRERLLSDQNNRALFSEEVEKIDRETAKSWMGKHALKIKQLKLIQLWAAENQDKLSAFENSLVEAARLTAQVNPS